MADFIATGGIDDPRNFTGTDDNLYFVSSEHANAGDLFDAKNGFDAVRIAAGLEIDLRSVGFEAFELISFAGAGVVSVNASQLVAGQLGTAIQGAADTQTINIFAPGDNSAAALSFTDWQTTDVIAIHGSSAAQVLTGSGFNDTIDAGAGDDLVAGLAGDDMLIGGDGNDRLGGGTGADTMLGGAGNDRLDGGRGADTLVGGTGDDGYFIDDVGDVAIEAAGEGLDRVYSWIDYTLPDNIEQLALAGTAAINGTGNAGSNNINGNSAANILSGAGGHDTLDGGLGADTMLGGAGNDSYIVDNVGDVVSEIAGEGNDRVSSSISYTLGANVERLTLTGTGAIDGTGNSVANAITGNAAANTIRGEGGSDNLAGGGGGDSLYGGAGNDRLTGGAGADNFHFDTALHATANVDKIIDFSSVSDSIYLDMSIFTGIGAAGTLSASAFHAGTAAADADDRIIYDQASGKLYYDADGNGAGAAVLFAQLAAGTALTEADFMVY